MVIFFVLICIVGIVLLPYWLIRSNPFPQPSGKWQVGTSNINWNSANHAGIIAKVWYPTNAATGTKSQYIDNIGRTLAVMTAHLSPIYNLVFNKFYLGRIITPAFLNATPAQHQDGFPVILLSPGFGGMNFINTFYGLEFASHGFIVVGINHPGSSAGALLTDGTHVTFNPIEPEVFADIDRFELVAAPLMVEQASNMSMVLDKIIGLNSTIDSFLYQKINTGKIFAAGHSLGGAASFIACGKDRRIAKGVDFDGVFIDAIDTNYADKELLLIHADRDKYRPKSKTAQRQYDVITNRDETRIAELSGKANLQKLVFDANHLNFSDISIIIQPAVAKAIGLVGKVDGLDLLLQTSRVTIDFFNKQT